MGRSAFSVRYDFTTSFFPCAVDPRLTWKQRSSWNDAAIEIIGDRYKSDVSSSAKFFAQLHFALANAYITAWDTK